MRRFMPAGILEFCADPRSPYHKNVFAKFGNLILFCGGSWRSTLTAETRQDMGIKKFWKWTVVSVLGNPPGLQSIKPNHDNSVSDELTKPERAG